VADQREWVCEIAEGPGAPLYREIARGVGYPVEKWTQIDLPDDLTLPATIRLHYDDEDRTMRNAHGQGKTSDEPPAPTVSRISGLGTITVRPTPPCVTCGKPSVADVRSTISRIMETRAFCEKHLRSIERALANMDRGHRLPPPEPGPTYYVTTTFIGKDGTEYVCCEACKGSGRQQYFSHAAPFRQEFCRLCKGTGLVMQEAACEG